MAGVLTSYALAGVVMLLVLLALPLDGGLWRAAGGAVAVLVARTWPVRTSVLTASPEAVDRNLPFFRAFVAGALVAEVAYVVWRAVRDPDGPPTLR